MPEQLLDLAQAGAALQQVGGIGVAQGVRGARREPGQPCPAAEDAADVGRAQAPAADGNQERPGISAGPRQAGPAVAQPGGHGSQGRLAERHSALTIALAHDPQGRALAIDV
jgi:hypothetical protein